MKQISIRQNSATDAEKMELRVRMLLRNGLVSRSEVTLASTEVLREIAIRLGYDPEKLRDLDITDPKVNPFATLSG